MSRDLLTIGLDDYFHAGALKRYIQPQQWYRFEMRIEQNTLKTLDVLDQHKVGATFFVMGWIADKRPDLVKEVARRGHEIANLGYYHRTIHEMTRAEFIEDLDRSEEALERAVGHKPRGYRLARAISRLEDLWVLDLLAQRGYSYDCSVMPVLRSFRKDVKRCFAHQHESNGERMWEFPFSTSNCFGHMLPISGGNYFRQFPHWIMKRMVADWHRRSQSPYVLYFHVWDIDPDQPRISAAPTLTKIRAYRNLNKMQRILEDYLETYNFVSVARYLELPEPQAALAAAAESNKLSPAIQVLRSVPSTVLPSNGTRTSITIVVPCFNEEPTLPYLANTLASVKSELSPSYDVSFVFVDDGSSDGTWQTLERVFGNRADCTLVKQQKNVGVAGTILNGIRHAQTEVVCSMDCDCTYDPHQLAKLIPMLTEGVDLVTGSPYHDLGKVVNVPAWRLSLSKAASSLYRWVLHQKLATYTSCFRVYRRSAVLDLRLREPGVLGVAEIIGVLSLKGSRIAECPTTLEVRMFGQSKMKILTTILGHLRMLTRFAFCRLFQSPVVRHSPKEVLSSSSQRS